MIDVVAYQEQAYRAMANFSVVAGEIEQSELYNNKANTLIEKINTEWWVEDFSSYADFRTTKEQAIELV